MITVITGTPGAGKTLYAISKLLRPLLGSHVPVTDDNGVTTLHPRTIYTNINGLLIDHELVDLGGHWHQVKEGTQTVWRQDEDANVQGLHNWHEWAKPGAVIVVDEFQRLWPPRPNGAGVPPDISGLDTHRHKGVDFILITQNPMNVDRHVHGLVGRHLHVRRAGNFPAAIVYEWDHCSKSLMYSKSLNKAPWKFDRSVYKLYRSADAHTKMPRRIPGLIWVVIAAIGIAAWKIPESVARISGKADQHHAANKPRSAPGASARPAAIVASAPTAPSAPGAPAAAAAAPRVIGCALVRNACRCYEETGAVLAMPDEICRARFDAPTNIAGSVLTAAKSLPDPVTVADPGQAQVVKVLNGEEPLVPRPLPNR